MAAGLLVLLVPIAGCGDGSEDEGTQPAPDVGAVAHGELGDLPAYPRSEPIGARSEKDGVVTQSFSVAGATPEQVISFYVGELPGLGWVPAEPAHREDTASRVDFVRGDMRLEVTATSLAGRAGPEEATVQYSLVVRP